MQVLFYLCTDKADIEHEHMPGKMPSRVQGVHTEQGYKLFPADKPSIWNVGEKIGIKLKQLQPELMAGVVGKYAKVGLNYGQWHCDWTETLEGEEDFTVRWEGPFGIGAEGQSII
jgi:hypothetical protein